MFNNKQNTRKINEERFKNFAKDWDESQVSRADNGQFGSGSGSSSSGSNDKFKTAIASKLRSGGVLSEEEFKDAVEAGFDETKLRDMNSANEKAMKEPEDNTPESILDPGTGEEVSPEEMESREDAKTKAVEKFKDTLYDTYSGYDSEDILEDMRQILEDSYGNLSPDEVDEEFAELGFEEDFMDDTSTEAKVEAIIESTLAAEADSTHKNLVSSIVDMIAAQYGDKSAEELNEMVARYESDDEDD